MKAADEYDVEMNAVTQFNALARSSEKMIDACLERLALINLLSCRHAGTAPSRDARAQERP